MLAKSVLFVVLLLAFAGSVAAQARFTTSADGLPAWVEHVGARSQPNDRRIFSANSFGAVNNGATDSTAAIQRTIDACAKAGGGIVAFKPGSYVTGSIFLKSNVHLRIDTHVTLIGSQDDAAYPSIWTRVAGIEMRWPAALININDQTNVKLSGGGTIDGQSLCLESKSVRTKDRAPTALTSILPATCSSNTAISTTTMTISV